LRFLIGHSAAHCIADAEGDWVDLPTDPPAPEGITPDDPAVDVEVAVGGATLPWQAGSQYYFFLRPEVPPDPGADQSGHWSIDPDLADLDGDDYLEMLPDSYQSMADLFDPGASAPPPLITGDGDLISLISRVSPVRNVELIENVPTVTGWQVPPQDLGYLLGPVAIAPPNRDAGGELVDPLPVRVEALIYAQNGSWFVIPGRWFNDDPDSTLDYPPTSQHPGYHEPLNIRISVYGAICENMPADLGSVAAWTSRWGGPLGAGGGDFLSHTFDPLLRTPRWETADRVGHLRFPRFPLTSDLVIWGERIAGPVGG
jgi:hypothetical protein